MKPIEFIDKEKERFCDCLEDDFQFCKTCSLSNRLKQRLIQNAEEEIKAYIIKQKKNGIEKISILDIVEEINIPIEQIEEIMETLKERGVKEVD